jgi:hypothetical protein
MAMICYGFRLERLVAAYDRSSRRLVALANKSPENESVATIACIFVQSMAYVA